MSPKGPKSTPIFTNMSNKRIRMTWVLTKDEGMMSWHLGPEKQICKLALTHQKMAILAVFGHF
jgi:hypothetical protein